MDNLIEILIPIIFFIIWTLSSISAGKKKQQRPSPSKSGQHPLPQYPKKNLPPSRANPMDDLKRTLESIFSEMSEEREEHVEPQSPQENILAQTVEPPPVERPKTVARRIAPKQKKSFYDYPPKEVSYGLSHQELRKAIVLMEILSPPVTLRE